MAEFKAGAGAEDYFTGGVPTIEQLKARQAASKKAAEDGKKAIEEAAKERERILKDWNARMTAAMEETEAADLASQKLWEETKVKLVDEAGEEMYQKKKAWDDKEKELADEARQTMEEEAQATREATRNAYDAMWRDIEKSTQEAFEEMARWESAFGDTFGDALISREAQAKIGTWLADLKENMSIAYETVRGTAKAMEGAFSDFFFDAMTGKLKTLKDYVGSFLNSMARAVSETLSRLLMQQALGSLTSTGGGGGAGGLERSSVYFLPHLPPMRPARLIPVG